MKGLTREVCKRCTQEKMERWCSFSTTTLLLLKNERWQRRNLIRIFSSRNWRGVEMWHSLLRLRTFTFEHLLCFVFVYHMWRKKKHCTKNLLFILAYTALFCRCWILMKVKLIYCVLSLLKVLWLKSQHWSKNPLIEKLTQGETENT